MTTRVIEGARWERHEKRDILFSSRAAALVSRVSRLRRSLERACTPLTKSEEKVRLLAVYITIIGSLRYGDYGLRLRINILLRMIKTT